MVELDDILRFLMPKGGWANQDNTPEGVIVCADGFAYGYTKPSPEDIERARSQLEMLDYRKRRAAEYPSIGDQLDALWKGGEAAVAMKDLVMAVKVKYPKPAPDEQQNGEQ